MGLLPQNRGMNILSATRKVYPAGGLYPFRMVIISTAVAPGVTSAKIPVDYPTITISAGEVVDGIITGPVSTLAAPAALQVIAQNRSCLVRQYGTAPIMTDSASTAINAGDKLCSSQVAAQYGMVAKATLSTNAPGASQHIIGRALSKGTVANTYVLCAIEKEEV
jgi:hypothetical protein